METNYAPDPERFRPLPPIIYVAFGLLFLIPGVGQICAILLAVFAKNVNLRSYSRAFLIRLAIVIVAISIVAIYMYSKGKLFKSLHNFPKAMKLIFP